MSDLVLPNDGVRVPQLDLTPADKARLERELKEGWRFTPATMAHKITGGKWIPAKHLLYISTKVATAIARGGARIIMTMPFRHGKSEFLSVNTPIWFLEHWPDKQVMLATYGAELAGDFSLKVRDTFINEELHHLLRTRLRKDKQRADRFLTTQNGGMVAVGIGGTITGRGGDLILVDDYIKNAEASLSETQRKATWEWFKSTLYTRLEPGASLIILATRWSAYDLIATCLSEMPHENWEVINLPMFAELNDPLGRQVGEVLWPERYDVEACLRIKKTLGPFWFAAMCQQDPKASMGGAELGDKLRTMTEADLPHASKMKTLRIWDMAATEQDGADWTVGMKISLIKESGRVVIRDIVRHQKSPGKNEVIIRAVAEGDGPGVKIIMEQEPGSAGISVIDHYRDKVLRGYAFEGEKSSGAIEIRATPYNAGVEAGRVYAIANDDWLPALRHEMNGFPDGEHDDQITCAALGYHKLVKNLYGGLTWGRNIKAEDRVHDAFDNVVPIKRRQAGSRASKLGGGGLVW